MKTVAVVTANQALSALVEMVLAVHLQLRVRVFDNAEALSAYAKLSPVHLIVCEITPGPDGATAFVPALRRNCDALDMPDFQVIALTAHIEPGLKDLCASAGIDEVIAKPMSPSYLEDRVLARARKTGQSAKKVQPTSPEKLQAAQPFSGNVIPLFPNMPGISPQA